MTRPPLRLAGPEDEPAPEDERTPTLAAWVERWVLTYARDPALWPALVSLLGHVVVVVAGLILVVQRTGSWLAAAVIALLFAASVYLAALEVRTTGPGRATISLVLTWVGAVLTAWFTGVTGIF